MKYSRAITYRRPRQTTSDNSKQKNAVPTPWRIHINNNFHNCLLWGQGRWHTGLCAASTLKAALMILQWDNASEVHLKKSLLKTTFLGAKRSVPVHLILILTKTSVKLEAGCNSLLQKHLRLPEVIKERNSSTSLTENVIQLCSYPRFYFLPKIIYA